MSIWYPARELMGGLFSLALRRGLTSWRNDISLLQMGSFGSSSKIAGHYRPGTVLRLLGGKTHQRAPGNVRPQLLFSTRWWDCDPGGTEDKMSVVATSACVQTGLGLRTRDTSQWRSSGLFDTIKWWSPQDSFCSQDLHCCPTIFAVLASMCEFDR